MLIILRIKHPGELSNANRRIRLQSGDDDDEKEEDDGDDDADNNDGYNDDEDDRYDVTSILN